MIHGDKKIPTDQNVMPLACNSSSPQIASVGLTEQDLKKKNVDTKNVYSSTNTAMGQVLEDKDGFVKFLVNKKTELFLGAIL